MRGDSAPAAPTELANFVVAQSEINIAISDKAPERYFKELADQCAGGNGWPQPPRGAAPHINDLAEFRPITVIMENYL